MASRDQSNARKLELLCQLTSHRKDITAKKKVMVAQFSASAGQLKDQFNVPQIISNKVKSSISNSLANSPTKWFIVSAAGGLVISKLILGSKLSIFKNTRETKILPKVLNEKASKGMLYTLAAMATRPILKSVLINKSKEYLANKILSQQETNYYDDSEEYENDKDSNE